MADQNLVEIEHPPIGATASDAPQGVATLASGLTHINTALKTMLFAALLPLVSGFLWFANVFTFFMEPERPRLCDVTPRHCDTALSLAIVVAVPCSLVFLLGALFTLDQYLSVTAIFNFAQPPGILSQDYEADAHPSNTLLALKKQHDRAATVLRIFTIIAYILTAFWTAAFIAAVINASLVLAWDSPFSDGSDEKEKYKARVWLGYGEALVDALLAYYMATIAVTLSRARKTLVGERAGQASQDLTSLIGRAARAWDGFLEGYWRPRSVLDKAFLSFLILFVLSLLSGLFSMVYAPFEHLRNIGDGYYFTFCALTALFVWSLLLILHSHRSSSVLHGAALRVVLCSIPLLLAALWICASTAYLILCTRALFCATGPPTPLPPDSPCLYVRTYGLWAGFAASLLGYIQGLGLGGAAVLVWSAWSGIRLEENSE